MWFQQNGAKCHTKCDTVNLLNVGLDSDLIIADYFFRNIRRHFQFYFPIILDTTISIYMPVIITSIAHV